MGCGSSNKAAAAPSGKQQKRASSNNIGPSNPNLVPVHTDAEVVNKIKSIERSNPRSTVTGANTVKISAPDVGEHVFRRIPALAATSTPLSLFLRASP